jgi:tRNA nucleotidyltransferase (CCA-adding enzyme)
MATHRVVAGRDQAVSHLAEALAATHDLDDLGVAWALVGGLAVSTWCDPRLTRDIDVAVSVNSDKDAERVIRDLQQRGYETIELVGQEATRRAWPPHDSRGMLFPRF